MSERTYAANCANQFTEREFPGMLDIRGSADAAATVTVNRQRTQRFLDYFYLGLAVDNSAAPQYPEIKVLAAISGHRQIIEKQCCVVGEGV